MCACVVECIRCDGVGGCVRISLFSGSMLCSNIMYFCFKVRIGFIMYWMMVLAWFLTIFIASWVAK